MSTGLNTVNLGDLTAFQQAVLFILMSIGNVIFVSMFTVIIRIYFFRKKLNHIVEHSKSGRKVAADLEKQSRFSKDGTSGPGTDGAGMNGTGTSSGGKNSAGKSQGNSSSRQNGRVQQNGTEVRNRKPNQSQPRPKQQKSQRSETPPPPYHQTGFGSWPAPWEISHVQNFAKRPFQGAGTRSSVHKNAHSMFSFQPSVDNRGRLVGLTEDERDEVGGIEYSALKTLVWLLIAYQLGWILVGTLFYVPYAYRRSMQSIIRGSQPGNLKPGWWGFFAAQTVSSAFVEREVTADSCSTELHQLRPQST